MVYELNRLSLEEKKEFFYSLIEDEIPNPEINNLELQSKEDTLTVFFNISAKNFAEIDSIIIIKAQLIDLETFPELKAKDRRFPIWLGGPRKKRIVTVWKFPGEYQPVSESDSLNAEIECASASFCSAIGMKESRTITEVQYTGMAMHPKKYSETVLFNHKLNELNSQVIILKRGAK
jgi:hypothetical protein